MPHSSPPAAENEPIASTAWASSGRLWFWAGLAFVAAAYGFLELIDPYFFCQDDALVGELPAVLLSMRAFWRGLPSTYNPFICLGSPTPTIGGFYPPLHLSYAIARHLLGDEYATLDVFAALHLAVGYCLSFVLARRLGIGPVLSALAGLTFVLSGPVVVMARCWHSFSVLAAFVPLLGLLVDRLRTGPVTWRWPVGLGVALGVYYHAGFPQLFVLGCGIMLVHALALAVMGLVPRRRLAWLVPALAFGAAISVPVFAQQWRLSKELSLNDPGGGTGVEENLLSLLLPYPLAEGTLPNRWGNRNLEWSGHFFYFGTVLLVGYLMSLWSLAEGLLAGKSRGPAAGAPETPVRLQWVLAMPALMAFLLALGEWGGLWWLMGLLPVGLRNNPFRALPWFAFYACLCGARFFETFLASPRAGVGPAAEQRRIRALAGIAGAGLVLVVLHLTRLGIAFYTYGFQPYPPLPGELSALLKPDDAGRQQRIMPFAAMRSTDPSYFLALPHNLPCLYGVPALVGYDPLVQRFGRYVSCLDRIAERPQEALAAYGVKWLLAQRTTWGGWEPQTPNRFERVFPFLNILQGLAGNQRADLPDLADRLHVLEIPNPAPLAFDTADPATPLPLAMTAAGLDIGLEPAAVPRTIVATFLRYPDLEATADGRPAAMAEDDWQRIVVEVPAGAREVRIRYRPPRRPGFILAAVLLALGIAAVPVSQRLAS